MEINYRYHAFTYISRHHNDEGAAPVALYVGRGLSEVPHKLGEVLGVQPLMVMKCMGTCPLV